MPLDYILEAVPEWFRVSATAESEILGCARIEIDGAVGVIEVDLRVRDQSGVVAVQEQVPGTKYPRTCHERHLQSDEHFCIGMRAGENIDSWDHAVVWWGLLKHFLELQRVAERTKRWPPRQEMSHGNAGPHQLAAIAAAKQLGIEGAYMRMLEGEQAWFSSNGLHVNERGKLKNGWLSCPVGCRRQGKSIPRSECCKAEAVATLLREERLRRKKVEAFYAFARACGEKCCGTMLRCPLRDGDVHTVSSAPARLSQ